MDSTKLPQPLLQHFLVKADAASNNIIKMSDNVHNLVDCYPMSDISNNIVRGTQQKCIIQEIGVVNERIGRMNLNSSQIKVENSMTGEKLSSKSGNVLESMKYESVQNCSPVISRNMNDTPPQTPTFSHVTSRIKTPVSKYVQSPLLNLSEENWSTDLNFEDNFCNNSFMTGPAKKCRQHSFINEAFCATPCHKTDERTVSITLGILFIHLAVFQRVFCN